MNYRMNHVTLNGLTLYYTTDSVYIGSVMVYQGPVNMDMLNKLSIVLASK
jgi:hypothetical protein